MAMSATGAPANRAIPQQNGQLDPRRKRNSNKSRNQQSANGNKNKSSGNNDGNTANGPGAPTGSNQRSRGSSQKTGDGKGRRKPRDESKLKKETTDDDEMPVEDVSMVPTRVLPKLRADPLQNFTPAEVTQTGTLFESPEALGFLRNRSELPKRHVPRYMLTQARLLAAPPFAQDPWDAANQNKMLQMEAENNGSDFQGIYELFQKMRDTERKQMEKLGLVDAENITKDLNDAIFFQGTCLDMCPVFERVRRALENNVKSFEKDPATNKISRERAIKAFSRPAAGQPPPMPSDVRPPHVLNRTLDYLVNNMLPQLPDAHSFIWDRTRSIRQDFIYQNYYGPEAIDCNERIVRIHLVSLHIMAGSDVEYSQQQELEQFNKALQTLTEIYQDVRNHGGSCPNEAEFRAYHLISHFRNPELDREVQTLPGHILKHPLVQLALRFRFLMSQNNVVERGFTNSVGAINQFVEFFRQVHNAETPILMAFLLETHFNEIRFYALKAMSRSYHTKSKALLATLIQEMLGFDNTDQLIKYISYYDVDTIVEDGVTLIDLFNKDKLESKYKLSSLQSKAALAQAFSLQLDSRLKLMLLVSIVNSGLANANLNLRASTADFVVQNVQRRFPPAKTTSSTLQDSTYLKGPDEQQQSKPFGGFQQIQPIQPAVSQQGGFLQPTGFSQQPPFGQVSAQNAPKTDNNRESSFNLLDFLSSQKSTGKQPTQQLGFAGLPKADSSVPNFNFVSDLKSIPQPKKTVHFASPVEEHKAPETSSGFNFEKPKVDFSDKVPPVEAKSFLLPESKPFASAPITKVAPQFAVPEKKEVVESKSYLPKQTFLKNKSKFSEAIDDIYMSLVREVVDDELRKLLPRIIKYENRKNERAKVIDALTHELFLAFVSELSYDTCQAAYADQTYEKKIKRKMWEKWKEESKKKKQTKEEKSRKLAELSSVNFKVPSLKRRIVSLSHNESFSKRRSVEAHNKSFDNIHERQEEIHKLWMPLNLSSFVERCASNVKVSPNSDATELKCLLIVEDWSSPYSKWLNTKFSLKSSQDRTHYENRVGSKKLAVSFESLPKSNPLQEEMFKSSGFIIFECGFLNESQVRSYKTLAAKLARDGSILQKLVQICDRYCLYQTQIMVIIWDIQGGLIDTKEAGSLLKVSDLTKSSNCVQDISVYDMTSESSVLQRLDQGLDKMSSLFTGKLTPRGMKKKIRLQQKLAEKTRQEEKSLLEAQTLKEAEELLKSKEEKILRRAQELQKHKYLSRHVASGANDSVDLSNTSLAYRTPNGSFANNTLVNLNNSFLANNSTIYGRNGSFLGSFNNGSILEESTPFGSPRSSSTTFSGSSRSGFTKPPAPKKVQELRDLTAAIRARYKK